MNRLNDLDNIHSFRYYDPTGERDTIIEFSRPWWDHDEGSNVWVAQSRNRKGEILKTACLSEAYVDRFLHVYAAFCETTMRKRETVASPYSWPGP